MYADDSFDNLRPNIRELLLRVPIESLSYVREVDNRQDYWSRPTNSLSAVARDTATIFGNTLMKRPPGTLVGHRRAFPSKRRASAVALLPRQPPLRAGLALVHGSGWAAPARPVSKRTSPLERLFLASA
eukprot:GHVT01058969.1.p1 GENE.GHVT01058969.1~~GHVT01058969.1.p1  ORF type:complete len:129 (-),score=4.44 GHVT01058969.1:213-599(-)